jgi:hypothetical protein
MAKKKNKITVLVPDKIANLPGEVLERVATSIRTAAANYDIHEVQIVAAKDVDCAKKADEIVGGGWDKIYTP